MELDSNKVGLKQNRGNFLTYYFESENNTTIKGLKTPVFHHQHWNSFTLSKRIPLIFYHAPVFSNVACKR